MNTWQEIPISELGDVYTGRTPPSKNPKFFGDEYPFITPSDMDGRKFISITGRYLSKAGAELLNRIVVPANSVCVSCIGWQMGKTAMTTRPSVTNQQINTIVPNDKITPNFLYYSLLPRKEELLSLGAATGVRTPILNKSAFSSLTVKVPSKKIQHEISSVLSTYDDLIENNTRRIAILEEMAQTLYREWFVHFRFPGHESVEMVDGDGGNGGNGRVPERWELVDLETLYDTSSGGTPSRKKPEYFGGKIPWVKTQELQDGYLIDTNEEITELGLKNSSAKLFPENTVVMAMYGATIGQLGILAMPATTNQACCALLKVKEPFNHVYAFSWLKANREYILSFKMGAAQQNISQKLIKKLKLLKPQDSVVEQFNQTVGPMLEQLKVLQQKNANLRQTRDLLLPRLISGELDVSQLDTAPSHA